jgi:hypothetical protein
MWRVVGGLGGRRKKRKKNETGRQSSIGKALLKRKKERKVVKYWL